MPAAAPALVLEPAQRSVLESIAKSSTAPYREVLRARVLLAAVDGVANSQIAADTGVSVVTVRAWQARFAEQGLRKFAEVAPGRGRKPSIPQEAVDRVVRATLHDKPAGHTHWSCRTMAEAMGISKDTVALDQVAS